MLNSLNLTNSVWSRYIYDRLKLARINREPIIGHIEEYKEPRNNTKDTFMGIQINIIVATTHKDGS